MNLKKLIMNGLKSNPAACDAIPSTGAAIVYTVNDELFVLKIDMSGHNFEKICCHVANGAKPKTATA